MRKKRTIPLSVSQIIPTFATHLVCRSKDVYVPRPAIKRESGVNPGLSRSCKSLIHANMMSLRFSGRRSYWATSQKTCLLHIIQRPWDWTTIEHETKVYYKLHATGYGACIALFFPQCRCTRCREETEHSPRPTASPPYPMLRFAQIRITKLSIKFNTKTFNKMKRNENTCAEIAQNMQSYVAPEVKIIEVKVEKGFAVSNGEQQEDSPWYDM